MKRDIQKIDDDIIRKKRLIEQILYSDEDIIEILDNPNLSPDTPEDYVGENIFGFLRVPGTQDVSKNFITFIVDDVGRTPNNQVMKSQYVQFVVFVHKDLVKTKYGMARHDLLGYLIRDIFNLSNKLGPQMELVSNREGYSDNDFYTRTLKFELIDDNSTKPFRTNQYEYDRIVGHRR
jgi:hypothetical protein